MLSNTLITLCLFVLGFLYAAVGHGGASGYIAIFSLAGIATNIFKPWVLCLNIIVSGLGFLQFKRVGYFKWEIITPFLITSIPFAFLGSQIQLKGDLYDLLLGLALLFPIFKLLQINPKLKVETIKTPWLSALLFGALLGFVAGLLNIGGGIFLSPLLILMSWANAKEAAAASAFFIFCNSIAGLLTLNLSSFVLVEQSFLWSFAATTGGLLGAYYGCNLFKQKTIRYLLASVMSIACVKLLFF